MAPTQLIVSEPQGSRHCTAVCLVQEALRAALASGWVVRSQGPVALDDESEPEPDIAVVRGTARDYSDEHPSRPVLVVEISESSLSLDRDDKGSLYARARLEDYWIVNLVDRVLKIYRQPVADPSARHGWRYASKIVLGPDASVSMLALPGVSLAVRSVLP